MNFVKEKPLSPEDTMKVFKARMAAPANRTALINALKAALPEYKEGSEIANAINTAETAAPANRTALINALKAALPEYKEGSEIANAINTAETDDQLRNVAATLLRLKFALLEDKDDHEKKKHFAFGDVLKETLLAPGGEQPLVEIKLLCPEKDFTEKCERIIRKRASIGGKRKTRKHNKKGKKKTMRKKGKKKTMRKKGKKKTMRKKGKKKGKKKTKKKRR